MYSKLFTYGVPGYLTFLVLLGITEDVFGSHKEMEYRTSMGKDSPQATLVHSKTIFVTIPDFLEGSIE